MCTPSRSGGSLFGDALSRASFGPCLANTVAPVAIQCPSVGAPREVGCGVHVVSVAYIFFSLFQCLFFHPWVHEEFTRRGRSPRASGAHLIVRYQAMDMPHVKSVFVIPVWYKDDGSAPRVLLSEQDRRSRTSAAYRFFHASQPDKFEPALDALGGKRDDGEDCSETACREVFEESGGLIQGEHLRAIRATTTLSRATRSRSGSRCTRTSTTSLQRRPPTEPGDGAPHACTG